MKIPKHSLILLLLIWVNTSLSQQKQDSLNVLFIGNSYTHVSNMPHLVSQISSLTKTKLITSKSTVGGGKLSNHWKGERGLKTKQLIKNGNFDIVVLQDFSTNAIEQPDSILVYVKKFSDYVKQCGATPLLYATWAREKKPATQKTITKVYKLAATQNNIDVAFVGDNWALAKKKKPKIELYVADGSHPSEIGAFLTACTFVKKLTGELPKKLPRYYKTKDTNGQFVELARLNPEDVAFCVKIINN